MITRFASLCVAGVLLLAAPLHAQEGPAFTVGDIRVEGLQRVTEGTVYNYLPINIGDTLSAQRIREAVRALYETGFFRDVELRRDGNALIVVVNERPTIESFELKGNKDIKNEDLQKSLRNVGLAQGKTFDRSVLEDVKSFLQDQYGARGKYAARIDTTVEEVAGQSRQDQDQYRRRQAGQDSPDQYCWQSHVQGKGHPRSLRAQDAQPAVVLQTGRSLFARVADRRPGKAALLLHGSWLRKFRGGIHPGRDRP